MTLERFAARDTLRTRPDDAKLARRPQWRVTTAPAHLHAADPHPLALAAGWPVDRPLAAVTVEGRWTVLAATGDPEVIDRADPADPLAAIRARAAGLGGSCGQASRPARFVPGWVVAISYELGALIEPVAGGVPERRVWPDLTLLPIEAALVHDARTGVWTPIGDAGLLPEAAELGDAVSSRVAVEADRDEQRRGYEDAVRATLELIRAGDVYQLNMTRPVEARLEGHPRALLARAAGARAAHGSYIELPDGRAAVSMSPELFLSLDATTGRVVTRPMKGTRPLAGSAAELHSAEKDRAELAMITDLMRNDVGRVARFGSMRVDAPRTIERHAGGGVLQATSTVSGVLRDGLGPADLLAATFPPGSVTGAPKIQAMRRIRELEQGPRGLYCGAVGLLSPAGDLELAVAIRTAQIGAPGPDGTRPVRYDTGAGIVSDSQPEAEWRETIMKTAPLRLLMGQA